MGAIFISNLTYFNTIDLQGGDSEVGKTSTSAGLRVKPNKPHTTLATANPLPLPLPINGPPPVYLFLLNKSMPCSTRTHPLAQVDAAHGDGHRGIKIPFWRWLSLSVSLCGYLAISVL